MQSCIYEGRVSHARLSPGAHAFGYRLFMLYLDLAELPTGVRRPLAVVHASARRSRGCGAPTT